MLGGRKLLVTVGLGLYPVRSCQPGECKAMGFNLGRIHQGLVGWLVE